MDPIVSELITQMVRNGTLSDVDIQQIAGALTWLGHADLARSVDAGLVEAQGHSDVVRVRERRASLHVVDGGNGRG